MTSYPIVEERLLGPTAKGRLWGMGRQSRTSAELPTPAAHQVLVYRVDGDFVFDPARLEPTDREVVKATSVTVVDTRRDVKVVVQLPIPSVEASDFTVVVTFLCRVTDALTVVREGQSDAQAALHGYLLGHRRIFELGLNHPMTEINDVRRTVNAEVTAFTTIRPPKIAGIAATRASVEVLTPQELVEFERSRRGQRETHTLRMEQQAYEHERLLDERLGDHRLGKISQEHDHEIQARREQQERLIAAARQRADLERSADRQRFEGIMSLEQQQTGGELSTRRQMSDQELTAREQQFEEQMGRRRQLADQELSAGQQHHDQRMLAERQAGDQEMESRRLAFERREAAEMAALLRDQDGVRGLAYASREVNAVRLTELFETERDRSREDDERRRQEDRADRSEARALEQEERRWRQELEIRAVDERRRDELQGKLWAREDTLRAEANARKDKRDQLEANLAVLRELANRGHVDMVNVNVEALLADILPVTSTRKDAEPRAEIETGDTADADADEPDDDGDLREEDDAS